MLVELRSADDFHESITCEINGDDLILSTEHNVIWLDIGASCSFYNLFDKLFVHPERYYPDGKKMVKSLWTDSMARTKISFVKEDESEIYFTPIDNIDEECRTLEDWLGTGRGSVYRRINVSGLAIEKFLQVSKLGELRDKIYVSESVIPEVGNPWLIRVTYFYFKLDNNGTTHIVKCVENDSFIDRNVEEQEFKE